MDTVSVGVTSSVDDAVECGTVSVRVAVSVSRTTRLSMTSREWLSSVMVTVFEDMVNRVPVALVGGSVWVDCFVAVGDKIFVTVPVSVVVIECVNWAVRLLGG